MTADPVDGLTLQDAPDDLRALVVVDPSGHRVGEVERVLVRSGDATVRMLVVGSGGLVGLGRVRRLVPVEAVVEVGDRVRIAVPHQSVHASSPVDLADTVDPASRISAPHFLRQAAG